MTIYAISDLHLSFGENKPMDIIKHRSKNLQLIFLAIGVVSSGILLLTKNLIIDFYNATPETLEITNQFIWVLCVTIIGTSYEAPALCGIVSGGGETSFVLKNDIIFMWGLVLPSSFIAAFVLELHPLFVFICLKSDQILKCIVAVIKVNRFKWIKKI